MISASPWFPHTLIITDTSHFTGESRRDLRLVYKNEWGYHNAQSKIVPGGCCKVQKGEIYRLLEALHDLPSIPTHGREVLEMIEAPEAFDLGRLSQVVERDPGMASFFLKNARRSVAADFSTAREAILYLGAGSSRNILIYYFISLFYAPKKGSAHRTFDIRHYWLHVLATSIAAEEIARLIVYDDAYWLFTYGLLHDMGILVLDFYQPDEMDEIHRLTLAGMHQIVAEKEVLGGETHSDVGGWLCDRWNLPEDIASMVRYHHTPYRAPNLTREVRILYVADVIGTLYYERLLNISTEVRLPERRIMESLGLRIEDVERIGRELHDKVESFREHYIFSPESA